MGCHPGPPAGCLRHGESKDPRGRLRSGQHPRGPRSPGVQRVYSYRSASATGTREALRAGKVIERSKEEFRQELLNYFPDPDILLNKDRMPEREALARDNLLPVEVLMRVSQTYLGIAEKVVGHPIHLSDNPKAEIIAVLRDAYGLIH